jgi:hypothetical protein
LGYRTPEEFERDAATPAANRQHDAAAMKFFSPPGISNVGS